LKIKNLKTLFSFLGLKKTKNPRFFLNGSGQPSIIMKRSRSLENATNNMIPTHRNILFDRYKDKSV